MEKKGQVTIFIIIAILIISAILLLFFLEGDALKSYFGGKSSEISALSREANIVKTHVDNCLEISLEETIFINSLQGGYYRVPKDLKVFFQNSNLFWDIPYYWIDEETLILSQSTLENQISLGVINEMKGCLNFSRFSFDTRYSLERMEVETLIKEEEIYLNVFFPVSVKVGDSVSLLEEFEIRVDSNYLSFYNLAVDLISEQKQHIDSLCISCLGDLSHIYDIEISTTEVFDDFDYIIIYYLKKEISKEKSFELYSFAHKFKLEEL